MAHTLALFNFFKTSIIVACLILLWNSCRFAIIVKIAIKITATLNEDFGKRAYSFDSSDHFIKKQQTITVTIL